MEPELTTGDRSLVNYFFMRLENVYGAQFRTQFSDPNAVSLAKREWSGRIITRTREDLHEAIELVKVERERGNKEFEWPDIPKILGLLNNRISPDGKNAPAYLSFDDPKHPEHKQYSKTKQIEHASTVSKRKQSGNNELNKLKDMF